MTSLKKQFKSRQEGFTIIELLIVIVVIGILAALVITTFSGIQEKARNTARETDISALHKQIEAYYAQNENSSYPTLAQLNDATWRETNMKGLDSEALFDPKGDKTDTSPLSNAVADSVYSYVVTPGTCANTVGGESCDSYILTASLEGSDNTIVKNSLN